MWRNTLDYLVSDPKRNEVALVLTNNRSDEEEFVDPVRDFVKKGGNVEWKEGAEGARIQVLSRPPVTSRCPKLTFDIPEELTRVNQLESSSSSERIRPSLRHTSRKKGEEKSLLGGPTRAVLAGGWTYSLSEINEAAPSRWPVLLLSKKGGAPKKFFSPPTKSFPSSRSVALRIICEQKGKEEMLLVSKLA